MTRAIVIKRAGAPVVLAAGSQLLSSMTAQALAARVDAQASAADAQDSAAFAEEFSSPAYNDVAAGEAATTAGQFFRVPIPATDPVEYTRYQRTSGGSVEAAPLATTAALGSSTGATMVGTAGGNVQGDIDALNETAASLLDLSTIISLTGATTLDADGLNKTVIISGATSFTVNLPPASTVGQALKIYCARDYTGVASIQAAIASGLTVDGESLLDLMAGESGTFVFDGAGWIVIDRVFVPIVAEMITAASDHAVTTSFTQIPMSVAGAQLMRNDVKALWNYSGGYFQAPRDGVYEIDVALWAQHDDAGSRSFFDVGAYVGSATGGSPTGKNFVRIMVDDIGLGFESLTFKRQFPMNKGEKLYLSIEAGAGLDTPKIVSSATLESALQITEVRV